MPSPPTPASPGTVRTDLARWPVVVVTTPRTISDDDMRAYLAYFRAIQRERPEPYVLVLDVRDTDRLSPTQRKMLTDSMGDEGNAAGRKRCLGMAMVFESPLLRGMLTAIFWVRRPEYPTRVFATPPQAVAWAEGLVRGGAAA